MKLSIFIPVILVLTIFQPMFCQSAFEFNLNRVHANRIILLGEWASQARSKWKQVVDSEEINDYGFVLLNRASFQYKTYGTTAVFALSEKSIEPFEKWVHGLYNLDAKTKWLALGMDGQLITSGIQIPGSKEFEQLLKKMGYRTPLQTVRAFLRENPDHIDAKTDLLKEVRRRAMLNEPLTFDEDLDVGQDLRKWGVLATETNNVFQGSWLGIEIQFFKPEEDQPERYSPLMREVFRRNIGKVESAIRQQPTNTTLWNIWAWMARSIPDHKWDAFIDSVGVFTPFRSAYCPSEEVCVWLASEARLKKDWESVIKFASQAKRFVVRHNNERFVHWSPGGGTATSVNYVPIEGYPGSSAYAPHLEALLMLGRIDDANDLFDEMIRLQDDFDLGEFISNSTNVKHAVSAARIAGMEEIAKIWEKGMQVNKVPYISTGFYSGEPIFVLMGNYNGNYHKEFEELVALLEANIVVYAGPSEKNLATLGWKRDDVELWALIGADGRLLHQDKVIPDVSTMRSILAHHKVEAPYNFGSSYIAKHGNTPGIDFYLIGNNLRQLSRQSSSKEVVEDLLEDTARLFRRIMRDNQDTLATPHSAPTAWGTLKHSSLQALSKSYLMAIESLLARKPSSLNLWYQWLFWAEIEDESPSMEPLLDQIKLSPLSGYETIPPPNATSRYYNYCKKTGNWHRVIEMLKRAWERDFHEFLYPEDLDTLRKRYLPTVGDRTGILLIDAYLNGEKPDEANKIFNTWMDSGGTFKDISKIVALAREKDYEWLAREWEERISR
ncbi:MAG: hypothetical protein FWG02_00335 [Holophagaceae bacterium]|nr:hypothetical protein [Holophagaceae bacterium]